MGGKHSIIELDKFVIFVTLLILIYLLRPRKQRVRTNHQDHANQVIGRPPSGVSVLLAKGIILTIMLVASNILLDYSENIVLYENEKCSGNHQYNKYQCVSEEYTSDDLAMQIDGFLMNTDVGLGFEIGDQLNHGNTPDGPWYWLYYIIGGLVIISGFRLANKRRKSHLVKLRAVEQELRPIIRQLANDPRGVIEGRINMPNPVQTSKPTGKESRRIFAIFFFSALISIITMMSFFDFFYHINSGMEMRAKHNNQAFLLSMMALGFNISGHISVKYLSANYPGESEYSTIPVPIRNESRGMKTNTDKPTSARDVLAELAKEMRATRIESEMLRVQLNETREKVSNLESELEKKALELETIQALSLDMERIVKQSEDTQTKNLSLMDSVLVGDALFNGDKIDKQVVNDPKAIAKAAIEAYKAGRTDVKSVELDF